MADETLKAQVIVDASKVSAGMEQSSQAVKSGVTRLAAFAQQGVEDYVRP